MKKLGSIVCTLGAVVLLVAGLSACSHYASSTSDQYLCVFDGSERGGQRLKAQVPPGSKSVKIDSNDQVVRIPASSRFYMATTDRNLADPGAPNSYVGNSKGGKQVQVEGQVRFRFNLDKACEWYSKHGRRNADSNGNLGFNVRGDANQGWFRFLNENFGTTMQEVVDARIGSYSWDALHFNFPVNADANGNVPDGTPPGEVTRLALGRDLGKNFTARLNANLGTPAGEPGYFCGIDTDASGGTTGCPDMVFQVRYAGPGYDDPLVKNRVEVENTKQSLETSRLQASLQAAQQDALLKAEANKRALLVEQAKTADAQAQIDTAKCRQLAPFGLDCDGHRPNGSNVTVNQSKP